MAGALRLYLFLAASLAGLAAALIFITVDKTGRSAPFAYHVITEPTFCFKKIHIRIIRSQFDGTGLPASISLQKRKQRRHPSSSENFEKKIQFGAKLTDIMKKYKKFNKKAKLTRYCASQQVDDGGRTDWNFFVFFAAYCRDPSLPEYSAVSYDDDGGASVVCRPGYVFDDGLDVHRIRCTNPPAWNTDQVPPFSFQ